MQIQILPRFRMLTALSGLLIVMLGCRTLSPDTDAADRDARPLTALRVELDVHGLSCPLCANNLDGQLMRIDGVDAATIDLHTGVVLVELVEGHLVTHGQLRKAVDDAGFSLRAVREVKPNGAHDDA